MVLNANVYFRQNDGQCDTAKDLLSHLNLPQAYQWLSCKEKFKILYERVQIICDSCEKDV